MERRSATLSCSATKPWPPLKALKTKHKKNTRKLHACLYARVFHPTSRREVLTVAHSDTATGTVIAIVSVLLHRSILRVGHCHKNGYGVRARKQRQTQGTAPIPHLSPLLTLSEYHVYSVWYSIWYASFPREILALSNGGRQPNTYQVRAIDTHYSFAWPG